MHTPPHTTAVRIDAEPSPTQHPSQHAIDPSPTWASCAWPLPALPLMVSHGAAARLALGRRALSCEIGIQIITHALGLPAHAVSPTGPRIAPNQVKLVVAVVNAIVVVPGLSLSRPVWCRGLGSDRCRTGAKEECNDGPTASYVAPCRVRSDPMHAAAREALSGLAIYTAVFAVCGPPALFAASCHPIKDQRLVCARMK
jgi:hypothetical protein